MVSDARVFRSMQNEQKYPWLYDSVVHQVYLCKFCELFCGHSSSSQEFVTVGINIGTVWLLLYYWTSKLINVLLFPSFPNSHHLRANFPKYKGPDLRYKWVGKSLTCNKHVGFKALCNKQVGFKALVMSKSFSSFLIGCVRRPTPRTDKGSSSITDNMITFNGISVLNFKFKRYSL
jgi:hypothetical protein